MKFEKLIHSLIHKNHIPGISILVAQKEEIILKKHFGFLSVFPSTEILKEDALYDIASLTKPLITAFLVVYLVEKEKIALDTEIRKIFPELPFNFKIIHLLTHTAGLVPWFPFYLYDRDYLAQFRTANLVSKPGTKVNYSCPGYILLYHLIEKVSGLKFAEFAREIIFKPLKLNHTFFKVPQSLLKITAPTENGNIYEKKMAAHKHRAASTHFEWRTGIIHAETHDVNSFYYGGTAGNSGLFSSVEDIHKISLEIYPSTASILKPDSTHFFWKNFTPGKASHRTCGFKLNSSFLTSGGRAISPQAIGHSGFTGTSVWLEPESEQKFILLSNRIHPHVKNLNFNRVRRRLHHNLKKDLNLS